MISVNGKLNSYVDFFPKFSSEQIPWFPRKKADLDTFADKVLEMGEELRKFLDQCMTTHFNLQFNNLLLRSI